MDIIASAKQIDISRIEVQHGKQGKFQAAYSGWNFFPNEGFLNMPDKFLDLGGNICRKHFKSITRKEIS